VPDHFRWKTQRRNAAGSGAVQTDTAPRAPPQSPQGDAGVDYAGSRGSEARARRYVCGTQVLLFSNYFLNLHFGIGRRSGSTAKHTTASATQFFRDVAFKNTYIPGYWLWDMSL